MGGVKSLGHCRFQTVYSVPPHTAICMSMPPHLPLPPPPLVAPLSFTISLFLAISLFLRFLVSMASDSGGSAGWMGGGWGGGGALSLPSQAERWTGSQAGRKSRLSLRSAIVCATGLEAARRFCWCSDPPEIRRNLATLNWRPQNSLLGAHLMCLTNGAALISADFCPNVTQLH